VCRSSSHASSRRFSSCRSPPRIGAVYPLAEVREAFTAKSGRNVAGKIILQLFS